MPFKEISKYLKRYKKEVYKIIGVSLIVSILNAAIPAIYGRLTDLILKDYFGNMLFILLGLWLGISIINSILNRYIDQRKNYLASFCEKDLVVETCNRLIELPLSYHKEKKTGEVFEKIARGGNSIAHILSRVVFMAVPEFFTIAVILIILAYTNYKITIMMLIVVSCYCIVTFLKTKQLIDAEEKISKSYETAYGDIYDSIINVKAIKSFNMEAYEKNKYAEKYQKITTELEKLINDWVDISFMQTNILGIGFIAIFGSALFFLLQKEISAGQLVMLIGYSSLITRPFTSLAENYIFFKRSIVSIKRAEDIYREKTEPYNKGAAAKNVNGKIEFENISVVYEKEQEETLKNISFIAKPGEVIALVGESGAGKTTLADLIPRFIKPSKGKIFLDGKDITKFNLQSFREKIAVVPQEPILFNDTVRANINYGNLNASENDIIKAAQDAYAHNFIIKFRKGYNQLVGERGIKLSAGQKQRIAIARAILRNPKILILDEATSALDSISEKLVQKALRELIKGKTVFIIAHRLSTIRHADKILVLKNGTIIEKGTHKELLKKNGIYKELHDLQSF